MTTDSKLNPRHPELFCYYPSLYRRYKQYQTTNRLPSPEDYGIQVGAPPIITDHCLKKLSTTVDNTIEFAENNEGLSDMIDAVNRELKISHGDYHLNKPPCSSTVKLYQLLTVNNDDSMHLVK